jgi:hypothetical protein
MPKNNAKDDEFKWLDQPEAHNYPAAASYLGLLYADKRVAGLIAKLRTAPVDRFKAKDIFRASQLSLLGISNSHIEKDRRKIRQGIALSPILLVRDESTSRVIIADGYHRLCAVYGYDEDAWVHCKIV